MSPDPGGLPRYPLKTMTLVGFGLLLLQGIAEIIKNWAILTGHSTDAGLHDTGIDHG
jgi:TRAP-type mannitol/chloroaromatic compound transport system permease small subunit